MTRIVILDVRTPNHHEETDVYRVPERVWEALTAYRVGVEPNDSTLNTQLAQIAQRLGITSTPHLAQREHITAHWIRLHGIKSGHHRWSCSLPP